MFYNLGVCAKETPNILKSQLLKLAFHMAPGNVEKERMLPD